MSDFLITYVDEAGLEHHGVLGQKWGIRRYQNPDGSLTELGKKKYLNNDGSLTRKGYNAALKINRKQYVKASNETDKYIRDKIKSTKARNDKKWDDDDFASYVLQNADRFMIAKQALIATRMADLQEKKIEAQNGKRYIEDHFNYPTREINVYYGNLTANFKLDNNGHITKAKTIKTTYV